MQELRIYVKQPISLGKWIACLVLVFLYLQLFFLLFSWEYILQWLQAIRWINFWVTSIMTAWLQEKPIAKKKKRGYKTHKKMNAYVISCSTKLYKKINIIKVCDQAHQFLQHYCSIAVISQTAWNCWSLHCSTAHSIKILPMHIQFSDLHFCSLSSSFLWFHIMSAEIHPDYNDGSNSTRKDSKNPSTPTSFTK